MPAPANSLSRQQSVERINVNLPRPLLDDLRRLVPRSRRSEVIARATARELRRLKLAALFQGLTREPLWRSEDHPNLQTAEMIDRLISQLRAAGTYTLPVASSSPARTRSAAGMRARASATRTRRKASRE